MKRHTISLNGRGDICSRSGMTTLAALSGDADPEIDFEIALMEALASEAESSQDAVAELSH
ncbi:hypothetical protein ACH427_16165 [Streptomyces sp. NPDC020379]|uniref:hypothetical protein n=1 Tax=Streptomyces sp. NPDC020379 TaxID=3365071 RepID=UPI00379642A3